MKNPIKITLSLLALSFTLLLGCNEGAGDGSLQGQIPEIELLCSSIQSTDCNSVQEPMFAGLISDLTTDCENYLSQISAMNFAAAFDASGETTGIYSGFALTGLVTQWVNSQGNSITFLSQSPYRLCAFVDTNGNGELDSGEPVGKGEVTPGETSVSITDWFDAI